ncbi:hypothetical protein P261_02335 [Lachnospiraceae bacterium TWA4]|nr:hypothetical protein P261_02335 [Lachnospiraceae bacterium TWA4]
MNIWLIILLGIIAISTILGLSSGLIKTVWSVASLVIALILCTLVNPQVTSFLTDTIHLDKTIESVVENRLEDIDTKGLENYVRELSLPKSWQENLIMNGKDELSNSLTDLVIRALSYLTTFFVIWIVLRIIGSALNIVTLLPVIHGTNKIAGGLLGFGRGLVIVWIIFLAASFSSGMDWASELNQAIGDNPIVYFLYENNLLAALLVK